MISPELRGMLPDVQGCNLSVLGSLRGETEANFHVSYDPAAAAPVELRRSPANCPAAGSTILACRVP